MIQQFGEIIVFSRISIVIFLVFNCSLTHVLMVIGFLRVFTILVCKVKDEEENSFSELFRQGIFSSQKFSMDQSFR